MPSSHPTVIQGQRISDPFLNVLDDYLVDSFPDEAALTVWTAQRNAAGRPVPNGKIVLVIDDFQFRHRNGNMWVRKFPRVVEETEVSQADLGSVPVKHLDWSVRPQAAWADHWAGEISAGWSGNTDWPFTANRNEALDFEIQGPHLNHMAAQIARSDLALRVTTTVDVEAVCVGAGGPGQDWLVPPRPVGGGPDPENRSGGAGGGAGAVTLQRFRLVRGDELTFRVGRSAATGNTYDLAATVLLLNNEPILFAPGGAPWLNGTSYFDRTDVYTTEGNVRVSGSGAGTSGYNNVAGSAPSTGTRFDASVGQRFGAPITAVGALALRVRNGASGGRFSARARGQTWRTPCAGGGGGAFSDAPTPQMNIDTAASAVFTHEHGTAADRLSNPGGRGVSLLWWSAARVFAEGGPAGSSLGAGNSRLTGTTVVSGVPSSYGSGGAGGGVGSLTGSTGQPGCVLLRWPTRGNPLVPTASTLPGA